MCLDICKTTQKAATYDEKKRAFKRFVQFVGPETPISEVTIPVATRFRNHIAGEFSRGVANRCRKNLATAWKTGKQSFEGFPNGPNVFLEVEILAEEKKPTNVPLESDFWTVYATAEGQDKVMLLYALHTAARRNEIFGAKVKHLDFERNTILITTSKRENGNTEHDPIPMTQTLRQVLLEWLETRPVQSEYLFVNLSEHNYASDFYGQPFVSRQHFFQKICKKAGLENSFSWHGIRHLTASILYDEGESLSAIQNILRHKSPNTTARYVHRLGSKESRKALDRVMDGRGA